MSTKISFLIPEFPQSKEQAEVEDSFYEQKGTLEEILLLGKDVPIGAKLSQKRDLQDRMCLELVHLHATRDHIVLMDPRMMEIDPQEELTLRNCVEDTLQHFLGDQGEFFSERWIYHAGPFSSLKTHTPQHAMGLNIDIWMPKDAGTPGLANKWRQLQNEIQMIWHDHPVNEARQARGQLSINSVWLYGIGQQTMIQAHPILNGVSKIHSRHPVQLDHRMVSLEVGQLSSSANEHHFVFAQDLSLTDWNNLWSKNIELLAENDLEKIQLLRKYQGQIQQCTLTKTHLNISLWKKLFSSRNLIKSKQADWMEYSKILNWTPL